MKPYDAEIEYLESTGIQWIDTGITFTDFDSATMGFVVTKSISTNRCVIGAYADNSTAPKFQIYVNNGQRFGWLSGIATITEITYDQRVTTGTKYDISFTTTSQAATSVNIFVFARNNDKGNFLQFNGLRVYSLFMQKDSLPVRNFVPVRKGTTGYLYDKVSGQLFGNSGTGNFILGPDKVELVVLSNRLQKYVPKSQFYADFGKQ